MKKRKILALLVLLMTLSGVALAVYPLVKSLSPSKNAKYQNLLEINISAIPYGTYRIYEFQERPIMIYRPSKQTFRYLVELNTVANGPKYYEENRPEFFLYEPVSTYRGCLLEDASKNEFFEAKYQGLYDPCHMGFWDFSGRNIPGVNDPGDVELPNLKQITNYKWASKTVIHFTP